MIKVLIVISNLSYSCILMSTDILDKGIAYNACSQNSYGKPEFFVKTDFIISRF